MKTIFAASALLASVCAAQPPLALVPADAAAVGVVHVDQLKSSALSTRLFQDADKLTVDGDAAKFLNDASVDPRKDVDTITFALVPHDSELRPVVVLQGHFDGARLGKALEARDGVLESASGHDYYRLPEKKNDAHRNHPGAVAVLDSKTLLAGEEEAVTRVLAEMGAGHAHLSPDSALGREAARLEQGAAAWAVVDAGRTSQWRSQHHADGHGEAAGGLADVLQKMSLMSFEATPAGDAVAVAATGYSADKETRQDLEDVLRGITAAWRLAAQSKSPETLAMVRKIEVTSNGDSVKVAGKLPIELLAEHSTR